MCPARWWWAAAVGLALVALAFLLPRGRPAPSPEVVWRAAWGTPGATTATGADGQLYGPQALAAGRKGLWLADTYGRRILRLPGAQAVELGERGPLVGQLAITPEGGLLFAELVGGRLWRLDPGQPPRLAARLADPDEPCVVEGLAVLPSGDPVVDLITVSREVVRRDVLVVSGGRRRVLVSFRIGVDAAVPRQAAAVPGGAGAMVVGGDGRIHLLGRAAVWSYTPAGQQVGETPLPESSGPRGLAGVDRAGRIFLQTGDRLQELDPRGRLLWQGDLPSVGARLGLRARLAPDGTLYALAADEAGLRLVAWRR